MTRKYSEIFDGRADDDVVESGSEDEILDVDLGYRGDLEPSLSVRRAQCTSSPAGRCRGRRLETDKPS